ncbi:unnamed protein product [Lactuca saligna]|uniref:Uncharacterized protein n=1 Tax=Lactuca saligna TaxID=75948 RepID=A0AA35YGH2_LACSI|nr:unnamed protein product [Lactuca saligna]
MTVTASCFRQVLVEEKKVLEGQADCSNKRLEEEVARWKVAEVNLGWLLHKGIVRVVDKVVESVEFALGVSAGKFVSREPNATSKHAQAMHDAIKSFMETDIASYLFLGELDIGGLRQICDDPDYEEGHLENGASHAEPSSTPQ